MSDSAFILKDHTAWNARFFEVMGDVVTDEVLAKIRKNAPNCFAFDDLDWIDSHIEIDGTGIGAILLDRFACAWATVRAYHACRPSDRSTYEVDGLKPKTISDYRNEAITVFTQELRVCEDDVLAEFDNFVQEHLPNYEGQVFFCLCYEWLCREFPHCWEHGSEAISGLARAIERRSGRTDLAAYIRNRGKPLIIECDVPIRLIDSAYLRCLCGRIIAGSVQYRLQPSCDCEISRTSASIAIRSPLPPECIVEWHDPPGSELCRRAGVQ